MKDDKNNKNNKSNINVVPFSMTLHNIFPEYDIDSVKFRDKISKLKNENIFKKLTTKLSKDNIHMFYAVIFCGYIDINHC